MTEQLYAGGERLSLCRFILRGGFSTLDRSLRVVENRPSHLSPGAVAVIGAMGERESLEVELGRAWWGRP